MGGGVDSFDHDGLRIEVADGQNSVNVVWRGVSEARDPELVLVPYLNMLAERLRANKVRTVNVDFRHFEYMNSATVVPILQFVKRLDAMGAQTRVLYDSSISWQRINFRCMRTIARTLTHVEVHSDSDKAQHQ